MKGWSSLTLIFIAGIVFSACESDNSSITPEIKKVDVPSGFPEVVYPEGNEFSDIRWELGKKLFYDPVMSVDSSISCASCHKQEFAFADNLAFTPGVKNRPGTRNVPSLANVAYQPYFTREGGVPTLEMQILVPIQEHNEFGFNIVKISERLQKIDEYVKMSEAAYGRKPGHFVITRALATFERSLISGGSAFDYFEYRNDKSALNESQKRGRELFFSEKTSCFECHSGFNFTDYSFRNNGLYEEYSDPGRKRLTGVDSDKALFKVPSLRNVALTAPYMHDGSIGTLEEVIEHYNSGGATNEQKSSFIRPLNLNEHEKNDLVNFLHSLTDYNFINDPKFRY